jgi:hypothetical protein
MSLSVDCVTTQCQSQGHVASSRNYHMDLESDLHFLLQPCFHFSILTVYNIARVLMDVIVHIKMNCTGIVILAVVLPIKSR